MRITRLSCCIHLPCPGCPSSRRGAGPRCTWDDGSLQDCRSVKPGGERNCGRRGDVGQKDTQLNQVARACERTYTWLPLHIESNDESKVSKDFRDGWEKMGIGGKQRESAMSCLHFFYARRESSLRCREGEHARLTNARRDRVGV